MTRPQLNETGLDPDVYLDEFSYTEINGDKDGAGLHKAWELRTFDDE